MDGARITYVDAAAGNDAPASARLMDRLQGWIELNVENQCPERAAQLREERDWVKQTRLELARLKAANGQLKQELAMRPER